MTISPLRFSGTTVFKLEDYFKSPRGKYDSASDPKLTMLSGLYENVSHSDLDEQTDVVLTNSHIRSTSDSSDQALITVLNSNDIPYLYSSHTFDPQILANVLTTTEIARKQGLWSKEKIESFAGLLTDYLNKNFKTDHQ